MQKTEQLNYELKKSFLMVNFGYLMDFICSKCTSINTNIMQSTVTWVLSIEE